MKSFRKKKTRTRKNKRSVKKYGGGDKKPRVVDIALETRLMKESNRAYKAKKIKENEKNKQNSVLTKSDTNTKKKKHYIHNGSLKH
jgi:hypothetical protein